MPWVVAVVIPDWADVDGRTLINDMATATVSGVSGSFVDVIPIDGP